jgi:SagB-type dehydrogenase family enzyme
MDFLKFETIKLPPPDLTKGKALMECIKERKSSREYDPSKKLTINQISEILYAAYGNSHQNAQKANLKTAASAVALYPLEFYLIFKEGIFYFDPDKNELIPCVEGDHRDKISMGQSFVKDAHFNLLIFANMKKNAPSERADKILNMDPSYRIKFACLDAGHCSQNVLLYCASENLKCVVRASGDSGYFKNLLKKGSDYEYIISICIGA